MRDVFNRIIDRYGGSMAAEDIKITFPAGLGGAAAANFGLMVQSLQGTYNQAIQRLYELGANTVYYVAGRREGALTLQRVVGPTALSNAYFRKYGDVCQVAENTLEFSVRADCSTGSQQSFSGVAFTLHYCVIRQLGFQVNANDTIVNDNQQLMFASLEYTNN